ncbi:hypothetical protein [Ferrovibrio sp.]|uniref:hypothetical protein n=1 Tax=Ferrovibrio sp. TaxID=1917215 RepID=UPI001B5B1F45|nr:hypothetical protein [Ferrovibrio sp.]MBP7065360.1 hypothetical protein [Ferrovibrio sp.]
MLAVILKVEISMYNIHDPPLPLLKKYELLIDTYFARLVLIGIIAYNTTESINALLLLLPASSIGFIALIYSFYRKNIYSYSPNVIKYTYGLPIIYCTLSVVLFHFMNDFWREWNVITLSFLNFFAGHVPAIDYYQSLSDVRVHRSIIYLPLFENNLKFLWAYIIIILMISPVITVKEKYNWIVVLFMIFCIAAILVPTLHLLYFGFGYSAKNISSNIFFNIIFGGLVILMYSIAFLIVTVLSQFFQNIGVGRLGARIINRNSGG